MGAFLISGACVVFHGEKTVELRLLSWLDGYAPQSQEDSGDCKHARKNECNSYFIGIFDCRTLIFSRQKDTHRVDVSTYEVSREDHVPL